MNFAFAVTGQGRSGTVWLQRLLNSSPSIRVHHELGRKEISQVYHKFHSGELDPLAWIEQEYKAIAERVWGEHSKQALADVSGYLRYCAPALHEVLNIPILGLIRDGRRSVRSMMHKGTYSRKSRNRPPIKPLGGEALERWPHWDSLERTAWYWADAYYRLLDDGIEIFTLEGLNEDYEYFTEFCQKLNLADQDWPTFQTWKSFAGNRIHVRIRTAELPDWSVEHWEAFYRIAGDIHRRFGYE